MFNTDPPEGIRAAPLDRAWSHWQASITGPTSSPYEGGVFYLHVQIPHRFVCWKLIHFTMYFNLVCCLFSYPIRPPSVRFATKIFHPNISRHGDIGLDCIQHNWSLALTIAKVSCFCGNGNDVVIWAADLILLLFIRCSSAFRVCWLTLFAPCRWNRKWRTCTWMIAEDSTLSLVNGRTNTPWMMFAAHHSFNNELPYGANEKCCKKALEFRIGVVEDLKHTCRYMLV